MPVRTAYVKLRNPAACDDSRQMLNVQLAARFIPARQAGIPVVPIVARQPSELRPLALRGGSRGIVRHGRWFRGAKAMAG
jgi:hypothetical protein